MIRGDGHVTPSFLAPAGCRCPARAGLAADLSDRRPWSWRQRLFHPIDGRHRRLGVPAATEASSYLGPYLQSNPLSSWISWEIVGVAIGALAGSLVSGRFKLAVERGPQTGGNQRLIYALIGGVLVGFGARLARGCTSGLGLSGGATLAVAAFVFLIAFFAAGFLVTLAARRIWQ